MFRRQAPVRSCPGRTSRRGFVAATLAVLGALTLAACETTSTGSPPTFSFPEFPFGTTTTSTIARVDVAPVGDPSVDFEALGPVVPPLIGPSVPVALPPPTCPRFADTIAGVVGNPTSQVGGTDIDATQTPAVGRCFGTISPPPDLAANNRNAVWEAWVFEPDQLPADLSLGATEFTTPTAFVEASVLGDGVTATPADVRAAKNTAVVRRAARFGCGEFECWMYLEEGSFFPGDTDSSRFDADLASIIAQLRSGDEAGAATPEAEANPPDCDSLTAPITAILQAAKVKVELFSKADEPYDHAGRHDYTRCDGVVVVRLPQPAQVQFNRSVLYQIIVFPTGLKPTVLNSFVLADEPTLGEGVRASDAEFSIAPPGTLQGSTSSRVIEFDGGRWTAWVFVSEFASDPADTSTAFLDGHLSFFASQIAPYLAGL